MDRLSGGGCPSARRPRLLPRGARRGLRSHAADASGARSEAGAAQQSKHAVQCPFP